ncbi:acyl-CoA-binding domain-containing protein 4 isoform X2 [Ursus maritimus]|uniref:Acyl-CoA-binding domain-containing protein 4 isoform X2 n=1 Tax=Ursus maritimus TaxID=29073 RepID=A0A8M1GN11_URSMA|nr:acyl-CoA-binding domain-containing protein 4 isoform X2 [Ursus maritimus]
MGTENESPEPDCQKQFQAAVSVIQNLPKNGSYRPSYEEMLRFYSYYKQATTGPCLVPRPGFWDPIGRYKWDAWNSLGKMSREEAMSAYITEMKLVAQKVIDTVPLGEVAEDMFAYFEPLYQVIPDMPRPPESFLRRVTGWREQVLNGAVGAAPEPPCLPREPSPPSPESQPPRDPDSEVFCDSLEQLEPELQVWAEQKGAPGGEPDPRNSSMLPAEKDLPWPATTLSLAGLPPESPSLCVCAPQRAACWGPKNWTRGWWGQFGHCKRACGMSRGDCGAWRACPGSPIRGPRPVAGPGPSGSRVPRCSSSSCGPSSSSGSSDSFGPRRGDFQWRGLCSQPRWL